MSDRDPSRPPATPRLHDVARSLVASPVLALTSLVLLLAPLDVPFLVDVGESVVFVSLHELPLVALTLLHLVRGRSWMGRPRSAPAAVAVGLLAWLTVMTVVNGPSLFAFVRIARLVMVGVLVHAVLTETDRTSFRRSVLWPLAAMGAFQAYVATAQWLLGRGVGYTFLGESDVLYPLSQNQSLTHSSGTFSLHHLLAAFLPLAAVAVFRLIADRSLRSKHLLLAFLCFGLTFTFSRQGALAFGLIVLVIAGGTRLRRGAINLALVAAIAGASIGVAVGASGWFARAVETVEGDEGDDAGADIGARGRLSADAWRVIVLDPLTGHGIGRYTEVADTVGGYGATAHNVVLLVAAETGLIGGALVAVLLVCVGARARRGGPLALAAFAAFLVPLLLDHFPYDRPQGIGLTAMWLALSLAPAQPADP